MKFVDRVACIVYTATSLWPYLTSIVPLRPLLQMSLCVMFCFFRSASVPSTPLTIFLSQATEGGYTLLYLTLNVQICLSVSLQLPGASFGLQADDPPPVLPLEPPLPRSSLCRHSDPLREVRLTSQLLSHTSTTIYLIQVSFCFSFKHPPMHH